MARGQKRPIEEKIDEKEKLIKLLHVRIQSEQKELEALYRDKRTKDLETIDGLIKTSGLSEYEVLEALKSYANLKEQNAS